MKSNLLIPILFASISVTVSAFALEGVLSPHSDVSLSSLSAGKESRVSYWSGSLEMLTFGFGYGSKTKASGEIYEGPNVSETKLVYEVYQNPDGIVRRELIASTAKSRMGVSGDIQLIDYRTGILVGIDKEKSTVFRYKLPDVERSPILPKSINLGSMKILGYQCRGIENSLQVSSDGITQIRQTWVMPEREFKPPLLEITRGLNADGQLMWLSINVFRSLEQVQHLEPSLFQIPPGYREDSRR